MHGMGATPPRSPDFHRSGEGSQRDSGVKMPSALTLSFSKKDVLDGVSPEPANLGHKQHVADHAEDNNNRGGAASSGGGASRKYNVGLYVSLRDEEGKELALGHICQIDGDWYGRKLEEQNLCVILVSEFKVDKTTKLPYPSNLTGTSFDEAETLQGKIRVCWSKDSLFVVQDHKAK